MVGKRSAPGERPAVETAGYNYEVRLRGLRPCTSVAATYGHDCGGLPAIPWGETVRRRADFVSVARGFNRRAFRGCRIIPTARPHPRPTRRKLDITTLNPYNKFVLMAGHYSHL